MEITEFKKKVVDIFCEKITDKVFLMIQNDRELMSEYLHIIEKSKSIANVNSQIAKEIKKKFHLGNKEIRNDFPESFLIQSHEKFDL